MHEAKKAGIPYSQVKHFVHCRSNCRAKYYATKVHLLSLLKLIVATLQFHFIRIRFSAVLASVYCSEYVLMCCSCIGSNRNQVRHQVNAPTTSAQTGEGLIDDKLTTRKSIRKQFSERKPPRTGSQKPSVVMSLLDQTWHVLNHHIVTASLPVCPIHFSWHHSHLPKWWHSDLT